MQFNSLTFIFVFLPIVLGGYLLLRKTRCANVFMLLASLYFYGSSAWWYLAPFFVTALIDFFIGQLIEGSQDDRYRKRLLIVSIVANLGLLSVFKYAGWLTADMAAALAPLGISMPVIALALPPAISFYTFQSMSYTIDIYRREFKPYRNVIDYLSFVSFFPHLVAGPIMRARDLLPQLAAMRPLPSPAVVSGALFMILFGLFQKTVLADNFGGIVELCTRTISNGSMPAGMGLIFGYAFALQIYCDFAAYSTIARGVARLFGVELMRNFLTPYFSTNPSEFWTRWHISLSTWLRDYLYIPLGGNRGGTFATLRNLMITMLLGGLWHGAGAFFIIWGAYHGLLLILYRLVPIDRFLIERLGWFGKAVSILLFFHLACLGWIFFRATPAEFLPIMKSIAALPHAINDAIATQLAGSSLSPALFLRAAIGFILSNWAFAAYAWGLMLFALPAVITDVIGWRRGCEFPDLFSTMPWWLRSLVIVLLFYGILFLARREANEFIYFAF
ncbi:MBOAT family protein [Bradyrhizobium neotropicale]|uniref:MBOAT family O-acyltransferase n=1 Tax=Bradyrhizobium neotropicale TaxID=1497615 RepID=UPI001AD68F52|nr:MBOAT family O-acyltransferase [Bradyrhizobium neotropicale]MBO4223582.1 MBOAT family protein [Bradyrhizobium neotropicale]